MFKKKYYILSSLKNVFLLCACLFRVKSISEQSYVINYKSNSTHISPVLHLSLKQSIDLKCKTIDWFLFECNIGLIRANS